MVSAAEIDALYESTLKPRLVALEGLRTEVKRYLTRAALVVGVPAVLLWANGLVAVLLPGGVRWMATAVPLVAVFAGVLFAGYKYLLPGVSAFTNYRTRFKHEVAAEVFRIVCPTGTYAPHDGIAEAVFDEPGLFSTRGGFKADDRVRGTIGQTPFEAADVSRSYSTGGKNSRTVVVFRGLFFHLDFNKTLRGTTVVDPKNARPSSVGARHTLREVALENPEFDARFTVYSSDEIEARYILTPAMMERILSLQARTEQPVHLAFKNNRAYLGVNYGRALFEPGIKASTSVEAIHEMAAHFALAEGVVQELDLNTRIWTKDVDASFLTADTPEPEDEFRKVTRRGDVTPAALLEAAMKATGSSYDEGSDEVVAPPAATAIRVDRSGRGVTVSYGLGAGFYLAFVIWVVSVAVALAAARVLPTSEFMPALAATAASIPEVPYASSLVGGLPLGWFLGSCLVGPIAFLMWAVRVRKVEIAPDAVRIWRGLRPWPRRYARPLYGRVVRQDNAVYVGRTEGLSLVNASASPMLAAAEAPWVAAEMRRALRETAR